MSLSIGRPNPELRLKLELLDLGQSNPRERLRAIQTIKAKCSHEDNTKKQSILADVKHRLSGETDAYVKQALAELACTDFDFI